MALQVRTQWPPKEVWSLQEWSRRSIMRSMVKTERGQMIPGPGRIDQLPLPTALSLHLKWDIQVLDDHWDHFCLNVDPYVHHRCGSCKPTGIRMLADALGLDRAKEASSSWRAARKGRSFCSFWLTDIEWEEMAANKRRENRAKEKHGWVCDVYFNS